MYRLAILTAVVLGQVSTCVYAEEPGDPRAGREIRECKLLALPRH